MTRNKKLGSPELTPLSDGVIEHINSKVLSPDNEKQREASNFYKAQFFRDFFRTPSIHFFGKTSLTNFFLQKNAHGLLILIREITKNPRVTLQQIEINLQNASYSTLESWESIPEAEKVNIILSLVRENSPLLPHLNEPFLLPAGWDRFNQLQHNIADAWFNECLPKASHHLLTLEAFQRFHAQFSYGLGVTLLLDMLPHIRDFLCSSENPDLSRNLRLIKNRKISIIYDQEIDELLYKVTANLTITTIGASEEIDLGLVEYYLTVNDKAIEITPICDGEKRNLPRDGLHIHHEGKDYKVHGLTVAHMAYDNPNLCRLLEETDLDKQCYALLNVFIASINEHQSLKDSQGLLSQGDRETHVIFLIDYALRNNLLISDFSLLSDIYHLNGSFQGLFDFLKLHYQTIRQYHDYTIDYYASYIRMLKNLSHLHDLMLDLSDLNLNDLDLDDMDFRNADLSRATLERAKVDNIAVNTSTDLTNAQLDTCTGSRLTLEYPLLGENFTFDLVSGRDGLSPNAAPLFYVKLLLSQEHTESTAILQIKLSLLITLKTFITEGLIPLPQIILLSQAIAHQHLKTLTIPLGEVSLLEYIDRAIKAPNGYYADQMITSLSMHKETVKVASSSNNAFCLFRPHLQRYYNSEDTRLVAIQDEPPIRQL